MSLAEHTAMLAALEAGTATPDQQRYAFAHLQAIKRQHLADMREADRDARESFHQGRSDGYAEARGDEFGPGIY